MRINTFNIILIFCFSICSFAQTVQDDFEGSGTITSWFGDDCGLNTALVNPYKVDINTSNTVLEYSDAGGQYANIRFDVATNFDLTSNNSFKLKVYVPSSGLTGSQPNQISLKLQDGTLGSPWTTQSEIIKPLMFDQWQEVVFDFENDAYINLDGGSLPPIQRTDFNRVVIQINGENNTDQVLAYLDDVLHFNTLTEDPVFDELVWFDEFDGSGNVDATKWHHQIHPIINGQHWANNEEQHYTSSTDNSQRVNGSLIIKAVKESYTYNGATKQYTSARINSKFAFKYGRVEVRAKLPSVAGTWPAIWLLGKNINEDGAYWDDEGFGTTGWPWCGEIDIMEPNIPKTEILGTWHWDNGAGYMYNSQGVSVSVSETTQNFHIYALEWTTESMKVYYDDILVNEMSSIDPFNQEFYIILNVAMGGDLAATIDPMFTEDQMEIDYVRVYQESTLSLSNRPNRDMVKFYPNPVKDRLYIKTELLNEVNVKLNVLDTSGRLIYNKVHYLNNNQTSYNVSSLDTGLYFINIKGENGLNKSFKFIKN